MAIAQCDLVLFVGTLGKCKHFDYFLVCKFFWVLKKAKEKNRSDYVKATVKEIVDLIQYSNRSAARSTFCTIQKQNEIFFARKYFTAKFVIFNFMCSNSQCLESLLQCFWP